MMVEIVSSLSDLLTDDELGITMSTTGLHECVIGGSYVTRALGKVIGKVCEKDNFTGPTKWIAKDIDVYHGSFGDGQLIVIKDCIAYTENVSGLDLPINTVKCSNLSAESFLSNNDLNITASCLRVKFEDGALQSSLHVRPHLWKLLFSSFGDKRIEVINPASLDNPATTCVRAAFKAKQMWIKFDLGELDPSVGTLAKSQNAKFVELERWSDNPLIEYLAKHTFCWRRSTRQ